LILEKPPNLFLLFELLKFPQVVRVGAGGACASEMR
jgi:hypothetical protein